jgi:SAM-dependent methyltransferase
VFVCVGLWQIKKMKKDREKWNKRYRTEQRSEDPSPIVKKFHTLAPIGKALDIATGNGRNALFLANQDFQVDAVDISDEGLANLSKRHPSINPFCADLDTFDIPANRYSLIINIRFLNRRLFPYIKEGLTPGGMLIFETFLDTPSCEDTDCFCKDYLLRENELLHSFLALNILFYQETGSNDPDDPRHIASLVATK